MLTVHAASARLLFGAVVGLAVGLLWRALDRPVALERTGTATVDERHAAVESPSELAETASATNVREDAISTAHAPASAVESRFGVVVHGTLTDDTGRTPRSGTLVFEQSGGTRTTAHTNGDSRYAVVGLRPGPVLARGWFRDCAPLEVQFELPDVARFEWNVVARRVVRIPVLFTDPAGEPLPFGGGTGTTNGLSVLASADPWPAMITGLRTERAQQWQSSAFVPSSDFADRAIVFDRAFHGCLESSAPLPLSAALLYRGVVLETRPIELSESELVFVVDEERLGALTSKVRVRFVDGRDGTPLHDVHLASRVDGRPSPSRVEGDSVCFDDVAPGTYELFGQSPNSRCYVEELVDVAPAAELDLGTRVIAPSVDFEVHVFDASGAPCDVAVDVLHLGQPQGRRLDLLTSPDSIEGRPGVGVVRQLPAGPVLVRTRMSRTVALVAIEAEVRSGSVVELHLPVADLVRLEPNGRMRDDRRATLEDAHGRTLAVVSELPAELCLPPGDYALVRRAADGAEERNEFAVVPGVETVAVGEAP